VVDRDPEALLVEPEHAGQEFPGPLDRFALEVVAERPVAEHFEERVVARGVADRIEVVVLAARAQAALHVRRAHELELLAAEEHVLELHHAGVREQQVGSFDGTSELDGTIVWPFDRKNSRNAERISEVFMRRNRMEIG
jgi:hypothetical protein